MLLLPLALAADPSSLCGSKTPPTGYRIATGYGSGPRVQAIELAREQAIDNALSLYGSDLSELQRAAFRKQAFDWSDDNWEPGLGFAAGSACFRLAVANEAFTAHEAAFDKLRADLQSLAAQVKVRGTSVDVMAPAWEESGCAADIGGALRTALVAELQGLRVESGAPRLALRLSALSTTVTVAATLDGVSLGGFSFPLSLFRNEVGEVGRCAANRTLGLASDNRPGAGGLSATVRLGAHVGEACEGDLDGPVLTVSAPSSVQVFSIDARGGGHFVGQWNVDRELSLGQGTMLAEPEGGDERLVAVAMPKGAAFSRTRAWTGYCKVPGTFSTSWFPSGAAIGTTTFIVHRSGTHDCPLVNTPETALEEAAPPCP
ncbi:MAG: hypothetical protein FJ090_22950 [Deltaproteobacteria bacterium]|nr:hypothetical protein [Deltaproteobacteria bacterium]